MTNSQFLIRNWKLEIRNYESGQIIIIAAVFMLVALSAISALVGYSALQIKSHRQAIGREQAVSIAEGGIEKAIWKLNNTSGYTGESGTVLGAGTYNITITNVDSITKLIKADAFVPDATSARAKRTIQIKAVLGTTNVAFHYGVQVGIGGLEMSNTSKVIGNVQAGGNIVGANSAKITGTAVVAGATGKIGDIEIQTDANAHFIEGSTISGNTNSYDLKNSTVTGNAITTTMSGCTVDGNATYDSKVGCTIDGTQTTPNTADFVDPELVPLPLTDQQVQDWEEEAEAGGIIGSQTYDSGTVSLGPKKIDGDLTVQNTATLNVTGTLWVTGKIIFENSAIVKLDASYGSLSGVIVAGTSGSTTAGEIDLRNSADVQGSGTAGSYMMLLSQRVNTADMAIDAGNTGSVAILYAGYGLIDINNSGQFKEITTAKLRVSNSATITYESGLANAQFSSGPGGGWTLTPGTWQLLQ
ncbi:MAG TPA: hypothetical protein VGQ87_02005 [Patescibacteria group bacterium]|jgi:hypothetical protein|nr:hypothetical protein [Patescibacteria group bacterium]